MKNWSLKLPGADGDDLWTNRDQYLIKHADFLEFNLVITHNVMCFITQLDEIKFNHDI